MWFFIAIILLPLHILLQDKQSLDHLNPELVSTEDLDGQIQFLPSSINYILNNFLKTFLFLDFSLPSLSCWFCGGRGGGKEGGWFFLRPLKVTKNKQRKQHLSIQLELYSSFLAQMCVTFHSMFCWRNILKGSDDPKYSNGTSLFSIIHITPLHFHLSPLIICCCLHHCCLQLFVKSDSFSHMQDCIIHTFTDWCLVNSVCNKGCTRI